MFDPYHKWLGIPPGRRPPNHYQLLGIVPSEKDPEVIEEAFIRQTTHLRAYQTGPNSAECTKILNELAQARVVLADQRKRKEYDNELEGEQAYVARSMIRPANAPMAAEQPPAPRPQQPKKSAKPKRRDYPAPCRKSKSPALAIGIGAGLTAALALGAFLLFKSLGDKDPRASLLAERGSHAATENPPSRTQESPRDKPSGNAEPGEPPADPPPAASAPASSGPASSKPPVSSAEEESKSGDAGPPPPSKPADTPHSDQPTKPIGEAPGPVVAASGFNDAEGINSDPKPNSPFALGRSNVPGGLGEPGWEGPWLASDKVTYQKEIVAEGDGAVYLTGTVNFTRRLQKPQRGVFFVEQYVRVAAGGAIGCYVLRHRGAPTTGAMWDVYQDRFRVLEGTENEAVKQWREVGPCPPDTWHKVTLIIDVPKRRWKFLADGQKLAENIGFRTRQTELQELNYLVENQPGAFLDAIRVGPVKK